jgi:DNA-binding IclR family transcriptional regulator
MQTTYTFSRSLMGCQVQATFQETMEQIAPAALRVVQTLDFLAAHPSDDFTLSVLARRLDINGTSLLRILRALVHGGYVERHPLHGTYTLGLGLVAIGQSAIARHPVVGEARKAGDALSEELGVQCSAVAISEEGILVIAASGSLTADHHPSQVGIRTPHLPCFGPTYWAFGSSARREQWFESLDLGTKKLEFLRRGFEAIRSRGYSVILRGRGFEFLREPIRRLQENPRDPDAHAVVARATRSLSDDELQVVSLHKGRSYSVQHIAAPIFDAQGGVVLELVLTDLPIRLSASRIEAMARRLRAACGEVTRTISGRPPLEQSAV